MKKTYKICQKITAEREKQGLNKCPKCDGDLVARNGKYGSFIGCINYPICKYTKK